MHVYEILRMLAPVATSYLGVGVQEGECVRNVVQANPDIKSLTLCDTWGPHHGGSNRGNGNHVVEMLEREGYKGRVLMLDGPSQELIPGMTYNVDLSYVDGDHSEECAYQDLVNAWSHTRFAMVVHDVSMPAVRAALGKFAVMYQGARAVIDITGTGTAVVYR